MQLVLTVLLEPLREQHLLRHAAGQPLRVLSYFSGSRSDEKTDAEPRARVRAPPAPARKMNRESSELFDILSAVARRRFRSAGCVAAALYAFALGVQAQPAAPVAQPAPMAPVPPAYYPYPLPPYPYPYPYAYPVPYPGAYAPQTLPYDEDKPVPPGYVIEERARRGPIIAGAIVGGIAYGLGAMGAASSGFEDESYWLLVPVMGPLLWGKYRSAQSCESGDCAAYDNSGVLLLLDFVMQVTGATLLTVGLMVKKPVLVRRDFALHVQPRRMGNGYGLGVGLEL